MAQTLEKPQTAAVRRVSITHPQATFAGVVISRYHVDARRFDGNYATATIDQFDVLMPAHLLNDAIERLLKDVMGCRYQVVSKLPQAISAF